MNFDTLTMLHSLFTRGNSCKSRRYTAERAQRLLYEEVAHRDWYEQALVTESRIKAFFSMSSTNQQRLIESAATREAVDTTASTILEAQREEIAQEAVAATEQLEEAVEAVEIEEEMSKDVEDTETELEQTLFCHLNCHNRAETMVKQAHKHEKNRKKVGKKGKLYIF